MHHLLAYTKVMGATPVLADLTGITDGVATLSNLHYILQQSAKIKAAMVMGATVSQAQINTPSLRRVSLPFVEPLLVGALPGSLPKFARYGDYGPTVEAIDEIAISASSTGAGEREWAGLWCEFNPSTVLPLPTYTLGATGATTVVANVWNSVPLTLQQTLPAGNYAVVGLRVISATGVFGRLIFPGGTWRPGVICSATEAQDDWSYFRMGRFGVFGTFRSYALPTLEILCTGADTTQQVYIDVQYMGP